MSKRYRVIGHYDGKDHVVSTTNKRKTALRRRCECDAGIFRYVSEHRVVNRSGTLVRPAPARERRETGRAMWLADHQPDMLLKPQDIVLGR